MQIFVLQNGIEKLQKRREWLATTPFPFDAMLIYGIITFLVLPSTTMMNVP